VSRLSSLLGSFAFAAAALTGCSSSDLVLPSDGAPAELLITGGENQSGAAGSPLPDSLEVSVSDERGDPVAGHTVTFELDSEVTGARVTPDTATTRADGTARALWVVGVTRGTQSVVARVARGTEPLEVRFSATVGAARAEKIAVASGNEQSARVGSRLANPLVVMVTDGFGNPVGGIPVTWNAESGSVDPVSVVTGEDGLAQTFWTLGSSAGAQTVTASSSDLSGSPVTFTATALSGSPSTLIRVSGDDQSAAAGAELPNPLVVRLVDEAGNGVPNRAVTWVVATGGGTVSSPTSITDENGQASTRWTLGGPGGNTLNAVSSGIGVVGFTATATSGGGGGGGGAAPARLEFRVQPSDTEENETMSPSVQVAVTDQSGDVVTDRELDIKLELLDDRDKVRGEVTKTTSSGVATFTIEISKEGKYRLRASADGLPSVESNEFEVED